MIKSTDYSQAKHLISSMAMHEQQFISVSHLGNFRKYLREIVSKKNGNEQFATRKEKDSIKIIRIR